MFGVLLYGPDYERLVSRHLMRRTHEEDAGCDLRWGEGAVYDPVVTMYNDDEDIKYSNNDDHSLFKNNFMHSNSVSMPVSPRRAMFGN